MAVWRNRGWLTAVALVSLAAPGGAAWAEEAAAPARDLPPPGKVRDLDYGDVLFHFFQDDYFESIVRLEAARDMGRLEHHRGDAELLSGGLYLSLGMHAEASRIFAELLRGPVPQSVSDRAHFYLARIGYQRGYYREAETALSRIKGTLPGKLEPERRLLAANVLMAQQRYAEAAAQLATWTDGSRWAQYARFNLGVALVRSGDAARGRPYLEAVGTMVPRDDEERALKDRANLALGFALLQERAPDPAAAALARVRLDGPYTNKALLGLGWAETDAQRPDRALVPWLELRERKVLDAAVQESYLAVPYAYAKLASNGQAAEQYRHAVAAYETETRHLDESIAAIRAGGFLDAILEAAPAEDGVGWLWQLKAAPEAPHTRYLYHLLASHEFQEGLRNYRDLRLMQRNLERWSSSLEAFDEMIAARVAANEDRGPKAARALEKVDLDGLAQRQADLAAKVEEVAASRDVAALATPAQAQQWAALAELERRIAGLPEGPQREALAERHRLLRGSLLWELDSAYKLRLWKVRQGLRETDVELARAREQRGLVDEAGIAAPRSTEGFAARVGELGGRMSDLQPRIDRAAAAQERVLANVAVAELEAQKARLASYATQAQFALAALYDSAVAAGGGQ